MRQLYLRIFLLFSWNWNNHLGRCFYGIWYELILFYLFPNFLNLLHSFKLLYEILLQLNIFKNHWIIKPLIFSKEIVDLINNPLYHFSLIFDKFIISFLIGLILTINNLIKFILIKQMLRKILKYFLAIAECPVIHASEIY